MSHSYPTWDSTNLTRHLSKRLSENPGCFENLLGISGRTMTEAEYETRSLTAITSRWLEFEARGRNFRYSDYDPPRAYHVDDDLVVGITDLARDRFVTCYHEHFDRRTPLHGLNPGRTVTSAQRRLLYRNDLRRKEQGRIILDLRIVADE
jgi:hypothetical protein